MSESVQLNPGESRWRPQHAEHQLHGQWQSRYGPRSEGPLPPVDTPQSAQLGPGGGYWQPQRAQHQQPQRQQQRFQGHQPAGQQVSQHSNAYADGVGIHQPQYDQQWQQQQQWQQIGPRSEGPLPPPDNVRLPAANTFGVGQASWAAIDDDEERPASWGAVGDISQIPVAPRRTMPIASDLPFMPQATPAVILAGPEVAQPPFVPQAMPPQQQQQQQQQHAFPIANVTMTGAAQQVHAHSFQHGVDNSAGLHASHLWGPRTEGPLPPPPEDTVPLHAASSAPQQPQQSMIRVPNTQPPPPARVAAQSPTDLGQVDSESPEPIRPPGQANAGSQIASGSGDVETEHGRMDSSDSVRTGRTAEPPASRDEQLVREEPQVVVRSEPLAREEQNRVQVLRPSGQQELGEPQAPGFSEPREEQQVPQPLEHPEQNELQEPARQQERGESRAPGFSEPREEQRVPQPLEHPEHNELQELARQQERGEPRAPGVSGPREEQQVPQPLEHPEQNEMQEPWPTRQQEQGEPRVSELEEQQASRCPEPLVRKQQQVSPHPLTLEPLEPVPPAALQVDTDRSRGFEAATQAELPDGMAQVSGLPAAAVPTVKITEVPMSGDAVRGELAEPSGAMVALEVEQTTPDKLPARRERGVLRPPKRNSFELTEVGYERFGRTSSVRRPNRRIVQPLKHWLNEKVVYERKELSVLPTPVAVQLAKPTSKSLEDVCPQLLALCDAKPLSPLQNCELPVDSPASSGPSSPSEPRTLVEGPPKSANRVTAASARSGGCSVLRRRPASSNAATTAHAKAHRSSGSTFCWRQQPSRGALSAGGEEGSFVKKVACRGVAAVGVAASSRGSEPISRGRERVGLVEPRSAPKSAPSASRHSTDSVATKTPAASIRSGTLETGSKRPRSCSRAPSRPSDHSVNSGPGVPGCSGGGAHHNNMSSGARTKRGRRDADSDSPSKTEAAEAEPNQALVPLGDGFLRAPPAEGSLHGCEIRVGTHEGSIMCADLVIPPRSHNNPEISYGKTLQLLVQGAERGALLVQLDGHSLGLNIHDNLVVRSGQEWCLRNMSEVETACLKMVSITHR